MEKITADTILNYLKEAVESKKVLSEEIWEDSALKLNMLLADEHLAMEDLRTDVAKKKFEILKAQEKRNVALAEAEVEAGDEYRIFRLQQHKVDRVEEFIKICKARAKSSRGF